MSPLETAVPVQAALEYARSLPVRLSRLAPGMPPTGVEIAEPQLLLLREAMHKLREAERRIAEQQERIEILEAQTMTDELTGLLNRRGFQDAFRRELAAGRRLSVGGVVVMVDLDGFKAINDTYGHLAGDHYLQQVARALKAAVRSHDIVARLGGDEFAVLLTRIDPETGLARAAALAERLNTKSCAWQRHRLPLRASFGAEPFAAEEQPEQVLRRADMRMYAAKTTNRKRMLAMA